MSKCSTCVRSWTRPKISVLPAPVKGRKTHSAGLPRPLPEWAPGTGFGSGYLSLGELEIVQIVEFQEVWRSGLGSQGAAYYEPVNIPEGYFILGSYAQLTTQPTTGWTFAVKGSLTGENPPLTHPTDYNLMWSSIDWDYVLQDVCAYFWAPVIPPGYKSCGFLVTSSSTKPAAEDMVLVREDLTDKCEIDQLLWDTSELKKVSAFSTWTTKPFMIGTTRMGIPLNTVYCTSGLRAELYLPVCCLKNVNQVMSVMPTYGQLVQIMQNYGPRIYFHPNEEFLPTSPNWFFSQGALLRSKESPNTPVRIEKDGANLPLGGSNDGMFWLSLPTDENKGEIVKKGHLPSAKGFVHVKPMFGGSFTDVAIWLFYGFNGPSTAKVGVVKNLALGKIGQHVGDWEHCTLRVDNFSGEARRIYLAAHAGGKWFRPNEIEFVAGTNRAIAYSARNTHAMYASEGENLQGDEKVGIGIRNDTSKSEFILDTNVDYEFIAVDYQGTKAEALDADSPQTDLFPASPLWVDFMREWGPKIEYDSKSEIDRVLKYLPALFRNSVVSLINKLPDELGGEEGPTGPKEKSSWLEDEKTGS
ncbi:hypothetical protein R1sor_014318 [Riccia sorocarpa]|uniref:Vacuolar protein sorting-associated protein 62 n=1 Tax=Riccia sorocarpa TaxID=122646 RepID=A0ABD3HF65_9MARC